MKELKIACPHCQQHISFPESNVGQVIACPSCGLSLGLNVPGYVEVKRLKPISLGTDVMLTLAGMMIGYFASYFGQTFLLRGFVSFGDYVRYAFNFLFTGSSAADGLENLEKSVYITAWTGVLIGGALGASVTYVLGKIQSVGLAVPGYAPQKKSRNVFYYVFWGIGVILCLVLVLFLGGLVGDLASMQVKPDAQAPDPTHNETPIAPDISEDAKSILKSEKLNALVASGDYFVKTDDFSGAIMFFSKYEPNAKTGISAALAVSKEPPQNFHFVLIASEKTASDSSGQALSGFDTVKCKIGSDVFEMTQEWSPNNVEITTDGVRQSLIWNIDADANAKKTFLAFGSCNSPVKVQYSSSGMGGSYAFWLDQDHVESIKKLLAVYQDLFAAPGAIRSRQDLVNEAASNRAILNGTGLK
jgi:hypothetical protein